MKKKSKMSEPQTWQTMGTAPKDRHILAIVNGEVRIVKYGKTSHIPMYGFCLADQGSEDFDLCEPILWMDYPPIPASIKKATD